MAINSLQDVQNALTQMQRQGNNALSNLSNQINALNGMILDYFKKAVHLINERTGDGTSRAFLKGFDPSKRGTNDIDIGGDVTWNEIYTYFTENVLPSEYIDIIPDIINRTITIKLKIDDVNEKILRNVYNEDGLIDVQFNEYSGHLILSLNLEKLSQNIIINNNEESSTNNTYSAEYIDQLIQNINQTIETINNFNTNISKSTLTLTRDGNPLSPTYDPALGVPQTIELGDTGEGGVSGGGDTPLSILLNGVQQGDTYTPSGNVTEIDINIDQAVTPFIGDGSLTIKIGTQTIGTFTANQDTGTDVTIDLSNINLDGNEGGSLVNLNQDVILTQQSTVVAVDASIRFITVKGSVNSPALYINTPLDTYRDLFVINLQNQNLQVWFSDGSSTTVQTNIGGGSTQYPKYKHFVIGLGKVTMNPTEMTMG